MIVGRRRERRGPAAGVPSPLVLAWSELPGRVWRGQPGVVRSIDHDYEMDCDQWLAAWSDSGEWSVGCIGCSSRGCSGVSIDLQLCRI